MAKIELSLDEINLISNMIERYVYNEYYWRRTDYGYISFADWKDKYYSKADNLIDKLYNEFAKGE